jgi:alkylation response protein AidB-like acyl-CoA dehydrogenase
VSDAGAISLIQVARDLAPQIREAAEESERLRRLPAPLVETLAAAGLFRLWVPCSLGGAETNPMTLVRVIEEISRADGAAGWCVAIGGEYGVFGGYLPGEAAREIYGSDPHVFTCGALRPFGEAAVVDGGYRVTGRWPLGSGCQHSSWIVGGCRITENGQPRLGVDGTPVTRLLFFPAGNCEIIDTWHSIGLRGTGSHDYAVAGLFVPTSHALSFREPPVEPGPLYALPTIALFATALAAVPLGIARHAIELLTELARTKIASRSRRPVGEDAMIQADLGRAEAVLRSSRAFLYEALNEAWQVVSAGDTLGHTERAMLWLAASHAMSGAKQVAELMFSAGGSASPYVASGLERCVRDIYAAGQHVTLAPPNYQMAGQAFLGSDMRGTLLLAMDDRGGA